MPWKLPWWVKLISYQLYVTFSSHERPHDKVNTRSNQTDLIPKLRGFAMTFKRGRRALQICMDLRTHCVNNCQFLSRQTEPFRDPGYGICYSELSFIFPRPWLRASSAAATAPFVFFGLWCTRTCHSKVRRESYLKWWRTCIPFYIWSHWLYGATASSAGAVYRPLPSRNDQPSACVTTGEKYCGDCCCPTPTTWNPCQFGWRCRVYSTTALFSPRMHQQSTFASFQWILAGNVTRLGSQWLTSS